MVRALVEFNPAQFETCNVALYLLPLGNSTLIGEDPSCLAVLDDDTIMTVVISARNDALGTSCVFGGSHSNTTAVSVPCLTSLVMRKFRGNIGTKRTVIIVITDKFNHPEL